MSHWRVQSTGLKTSSAAINTIGGKVHGVELISDGTNAATLIVYADQAATSGKEIMSLSIPATTAAPQIYPLNAPIVCPTGIYAAVTGTGAKYIIHWSAGD